MPVRLSGQHVHEVDLSAQMPERREGVAGWTATPTESSSSRADQMSLQGYAVDSTWKL
jgi:hypothetical protein